MRKYTLFIMIAAGVVFTPLLAWGQVAEADPGAGMTGSHHDFTWNSPHGGAFRNPTGAAVDGDGVALTDVGLCTYCHTPHKAFTTNLLWNHKLSSQTYSWTDPTTTAGTPLPDFPATWEGASAKCLSCHDGTVAIGDVALFAEVAPNTLDSRTMNEVDDFFVMAAPGGSLDGNHPVAIPYPYQNQASIYNGSTTGSGATLSEFVADPTTNGIRLFSDDGSGHVTAGPATGKAGIECSSCHDPHNGATVTGDFLLRGDIAGDTLPYICLKCHNK